MSDTLKSLEHKYVAAEKEENLDEIIKICTQMINHPDADDEIKTLEHNNRGTAYCRKGEHDRAIQNFDKAIEINQNYVGAYYNRGIAYCNKGEYNRGIQDYNKAIELRPDHAAAYYNRGIAYGQKGEYDRAIQDYDKAIEIKPDYTRAIINRSLAMASRHAEEIRQEVSDKYEKNLKEQLQKQQGEFDQKLESRLEKIVDYYKEREEYHKAKLEGSGGLEKQLSYKIFVLFTSAFLIYSGMIGLYVYTSIYLRDSIGFPPYDALPFILVGTLILSPLFWDVRILRQKVREQSVLREDAHTNYVMSTQMNSSRFNASKEVHEELLKKFFDHHDQRGSAKLIASLDRLAKKGDSDNIVQAIMDQTKKE